MFKATDAFATCLAVAACYYYLEFSCSLDNLLPTVLRDVFVLCVVWNVYCVICKLLVDLCYRTVPTDRKAVLVTGCDTGFGNLFAKALSNAGK